MRPEKGDGYIQIPVTFDSVSKPGGLTNDKFILSALILLVWLAVAIIICFTDMTIGGKIVFDVVSFILALSFARFIVMRERYFMKRKMDLVEKDYKITYSTIWNIYEVSDHYPFICRYANGLKSIFVMFEKDVIVGKDPDNEFYHYEAIAEAYLQMSKRNMDCMHIDYMDTVGKDDRVKGLFDLASKAENPVLGDVLTRIFDNVEGIMQNSYASYDVYCFYYNGKDELFLDELEVVINAFLDGNYLRYTILDKEAIGELVKSIFNIDKFSVNFASEKLFTDIGSTAYLKPIWVERNGERKILNKTREELEEERKTREAEKEMRRSKIKQRGSSGKMLRKLKEEQEVDLFEQGSQDNQGYYDNQEYTTQDYNNQGYNNQDYNNQSYVEDYSEEYIEETDGYAEDEQNIEYNNQTSNSDDSDDEYIDLF